VSKSIIFWIAAIGTGLVVNYIVVAVVRYHSMRISRREGQLPPEDKRLIFSNFLFIIATPKLDEVNLEKALQVAPHIAVWLVRKDQVYPFKSEWTEEHWTEEHQSVKHRTIQASPEIQPAPPDAGDSQRDDTLFDDSINDEYLSRSNWLWCSID
jgi:hypothetical protein